MQKDCAGFTDARAGRERKLGFIDDLLPVAEEKLGSVVVPNSDSFRMAVFGDASSSMNVAIKCANILGSLMSVALNASLSFFNSQHIAAPKVPRCTKDVSAGSATLVLRRQPAHAEGRPRRSWTCARR